MRSSGLFAIASLPVALAFAVAAPQESSPKPAAGAELQMKKEAPPEIWQIDLVPTGTGFTVTKPVLEGDVWVFRVWPDRQVVRLPKSKVKNMVRRQQDIDKEVLYRIDLNPSGQMYARDEPKVAGGTYQFHAWKGGTLMSVRPGDVQKVTRLQGMDAMKVHLDQVGAKPIGNLAMQGPRTAETSGAPASHAEPGSMGAAQNLPPGNWIYNGVPGVTEAWAPASAVVAQPGDVPKAAEPH